MSQFHCIYEVYNTYPLNYTNSTESDDYKTELNICVISDIKEYHKRNNTMEFLYNEIDKNSKRLEGFSHLSFQFSTHITTEEIEQDKIFHVLFRLLGSECVWSQTYKDFKEGFEEYEKMKKEDEESLFTTNNNLEQVIVRKVGQKIYSSSYYERNHHDERLNYTKNCVRLVYLPVKLHVVTFEQFSQYLQNI